MAGVYVALSVSGLRRIEQAWLEARALGDLYRAEIAALSTETSDYRITAGDTVEERLRRVTLDYADAIADLADETGAVLAVDPRVRRAQAAIIDELRSVVRDSRAAADNLAFTLGPFPYEIRVKPHLDAAMALWRLDPGTAPEPPPLPAMSRRRTTAPLHSQPTGTRLLTFADGGLLEIDVDSGRVEGLGTVSLVVPVGDRLVVLDAGYARVWTAEGYRTVAEADNIVADSNHRSSVWLATTPDGPDATAHPSVTVVRRVTVDGRVDVPARKVDGSLVAAAGRWLATATGEAGLAVHDLERPSFRFRRTAGTVHALAAGVLAWTDHSHAHEAPAVEVRDLARGVDRRIDAPVPGATVETATFSPDHRTLAVAWRSSDDPQPTTEAPGFTLAPGTVWLYDVSDLAARRTPLPSGPFRSALAWSRDGRWLFALAQRDDFRQGAIMAHRVGTTVAEPLRIEGEFHTLAAL